MASSGAEEVKLASQPGGSVRVGSAVVKPPSYYASSPLERRHPKPAESRLPLAGGCGSQSNVRVLRDRLCFFSGIPPHRAYLGVPATGTAGSAFIPKVSQHSAVPLVPFSSPCRFEQTVYSYRPYWRLESLRFRSGILGKRAFSSPQPAVYPTCPSPPKAASRKQPLVIESAMPTNQPSTWTSKPRINTFMKPTSAKVPSCPQRESSNTGIPSSTFDLAASYYYGDKGDMKMDPRPARLNKPVPSLTCSTPFPADRQKCNPESVNDVILEEIYQAQSVESCAPTVVSERTVSSSEGCVGQVTGDVEKASVSFQITPVEAEQRLPKISSQRRNEIRNGLVKQPGLDGCPAEPKLVRSRFHDGTEKQEARTSMQPLLGQPRLTSPTKASRFCLTNGEMEASPAQVTTLCTQNTESGNAPSVSNSPSLESIQVNASTILPQGECVEPVFSHQPSVYSVATQISAFHLSKEAKPLVKEEDQPCIVMKDLDPDHEAMMPDMDADEEELPEELENDSNVEDDDGSDCCSINDASSASSMVVISRSCIEEPVVRESEENKVLKPALVPSLFPNVLPTLYFSTPDEKVELLSSEQKKLLKWKMSTVTPNVVKHTIARSHFKASKKSYDWLGCWGHHMKSPGFKAIREYQKLNHFPGSFQIGRKDRLWRNLSKMQARFGKREFNFFPQSFVLPQDIRQLKKAWEESGSKQKWIIKPPASARGIGIQVIHKWSQLPRKRPLLVQKYLHKPYLISGNKFDLRIYVHVTSYDPLRIYMFTDGLVRFASCKYSSSMKSLSNKFIHITNYSVNKNNSAYQPNSDDKACQGHKWALKALWQYLNSKGVNTSLIWEKIKDIVIKTIIASDPYVNSLVKMHVRCPYSCHELFGFDIMLDENLKPWVLEVNISPSLHSNSPLDVAIKGQMIRDVLNLAGFVLPQKEDVISFGNASSSSSSLSTNAKEKTKYVTELSSDEKVKRAYFLSQRFAEQEFLSSILDVLTPDDVRVLAETEDEFCRRGEFERVFPTPSSSRYLRFFEQPRYLNILLDQWEQKYCLNRQKGISVLKSFCQKGVHLGNSSDPAHLWSSKSSAFQKLESHGPMTPKQESVRVSLTVNHGRKAHEPEEMVKGLWSVPASQSLPLIENLEMADSQACERALSRDCV
ncbi:tubulin monoglutamylase TTLL4 [Lepisosteus oculatus]|uniref:tubulin monoglutamylase TTLL4 n=1 Tax=Lepisosteus oculatus TaxID=7918 RepID=UPI0035F526FA